MPNRRILAIVLLFVTPITAAEERTAAPVWPSWRGPNADGSAAAGDYPVQWSDTKNVAWKTKLPGIGCSTPIVWGDHIILSSPAEGQDTVLSIEWSGRLRWQTAIGRDRGGKHRNGSGSNSSPVTDGRYIFAYFRSGNLAALDLGGRVLWKTNLQERFGEDTLWWDIGTSPVLTENNVVVAVMHGDDSYLAAFDKVTGRLSWRVPRNYECPIEGDHSYTTPIVIRHRDKEALVVWGAEHVTAHDAADGQILWSCGGFNPQRNRNWLAVASQVITDDMVVVPYGRGSHVTGIKLGGEGDVTDTHRLWTQDNAGGMVPTPAARDGKVYLLGDRGEVTCLDAGSGDRLWSAELPQHRAKYYASPLLAGGKLYATREDGVIHVAEANGTFKVLAENHLGERMIASPVAVAGRLLLRGERHLFCIDAQ